MRVGLVGSPRDLHLRRWGSALARAGAEVWVFGLEVAPQDSFREEDDIYLPGRPPLPYVRLGRGIARPRYMHFMLSGRALALLLRKYGIAVAHPVHLSPYGVWVYLSGFQPYVPFAMGVELEYTSRGRQQAQRGFWSRNPVLTWLRQRLLPHLLSPTLRRALLIAADNYTICENIKLLEKTKMILEVSAGIDLGGEGDRLDFPQDGVAGWILAPRGLTQFYQADRILEGFALYSEQGGRLGLILLTNLYTAEKKILEMSKYFQEKFSEKIITITRLLPPEEMQVLWQKVVAFLSAPSYDGYSYSVAEGRWAGAIPLLNAIPGNLEVATPHYNALFIHPFTPPQIARTLHLLESQLPVLQKTFGPRNQAWIQRFSDIDRHARLFLETLASCLVQGPGNSD